MDKYSVLVIDDDAMILDAAEEALRHDFNVSTAMTGNEALDLIFGGFRPDLILLDINMPGLNGYQVLEKLHENSKTADIPVILLTGLDPEENEENSFILGAQDYISKPFVQKALPLRVKNHIIMANKIRGNDNLDIDKLTSLQNPLTNTEMKVARLLAKGYSNEEIVEELYYSMSYVKKLVVRVIDKLGIEHRGKIINFFKK
jgi:Response regulator containing a CheY-like receiver domain and an HTH DNA-binding domain